MSSRLSLGGGSFRDSSSRMNSRRRQSMGAAATPSKDRRAMLAEWRKSKRDTPNDESNELQQNKRERDDASITSTGATVPIEGTTALERYRLRKQAKLLEQQYQTDQQHHSPAPTRPPLLPTQPSSNRPTIMLADDDEHSSTNYGSSSLSGTPSFKRRLTTSSGKARRRTIAPGSHSRPRNPARETSLSQESIPDYSQQSQQLSQLTTASAPTPRTQAIEELGLVEGAGLRSTISEQQQIIDRLEKEKIQLSMSVAPMEAMFLQKEDAWNKEQNRLLQVIDELRQTSLETDESYRDIQFKCDALAEECTQLRFAARKASSSLNVKSADNSSWSRQVQNDRDVADLKEKLRSADEEIKTLRLEKVSVEKEVNATRIELDSVVRTLDQVQVEYDELAASKSQNKEAEIQLEVLTREHIATSAQLNAVCSDLAATKARNEASMTAKDGDHKKEIANLQFEMSVLKTRASKVIDDDEVLETEEEDEAVLRARIEERDRRITELEVQLLEGEQLRRQMHNRIQELRGNIRVFVRTRPFLPGDGGDRKPSIEFCPDGESLDIADHRGGGSHAFRFDKIFSPSSGQNTVFDEVSDFVQSALDGYHVCLFSYGQTGSGKTHTMQGSGNGVMRGIIPRAVEKILQQAKGMKNQKWDFRLTASFLEIYNEDLRDLLFAMANGSSKSKPVKLGIKRNREGKSFVENLTEIPIDTANSANGMQQLDLLMEHAARARSVASTKMNAQSSRSHSVFMLHLHGYNEDTGATVHGALNLCDLAGSERLDRSGAGADAKRLRETQAINKSLSCLGDVFNALATGASHVPYRNSKLTYLLQDCLSGDGKALMFVNLSPTFASSNESLCSLRFAQRVNSVELGKATKHIQYGAGKKR